MNKKELKINIYIKVSGEGGTFIIANTEWDSQGEGKRKLRSLTAINLLTGQPKVFGNYSEDSFQILEEDDLLEALMSIQRQLKHNLDEVSTVLTRLRNNEDRK